MTEPSFGQRQEAQADERREQIGQRAAMSQQMSQQSEYLRNPDFFDTLADPEPDSDKYDWLVDELTPLFSPGQVKGYRDEDYARERNLLNANLGDRYATERTPGRILRQNPRYHALAQGVRGSKANPDPLNDPAYTAPITSEKQRVVNEAMNLATTHQSGATQGFAVDQATTATTEHRTVKNEEEARGIRQKVAEVFG